MNGLVITGGEAPSISIIGRHAETADIIVAADSGLDTAHRAGVRVDLSVGDFDSLEGRELIASLDAAQVISFPEAKDETDTEIAVRLCRERGATAVTILGGGGGRMSHFLGILSLFDRENPPVAWITDSAEFVCIMDSVTVYGRVGEYVSFFPLGCETCEMESSGLRWPLNRVIWHRGDIGVSNEFSEPSACVRVKRGRLLMVRDAVEGEVS